MSVLSTSSLSDDGSHPLPVNYRASSTGRKRIDCRTQLDCTHTPACYVFCGVDIPPDIWEKEEGASRQGKQKSPGHHSRVPIPTICGVCHTGGNHQSQLSLTHTHHFSSFQAVENQVGNTSCLQIFCVRTRVHYIQCRCLFRNANLLWLEDSSPLLQPASIIRFKFLYFIAGFGCKQDPRSNTKSPELCFFPVPPISLCLAKAIGKVSHTDGIRVVLFKILCLKKTDRDEKVPQPCVSDEALAWTFQLCHIWSCTCLFAIT